MQINVGRNFSRQILTLQSVVWLLLFSFSQITISNAATIWNGPKTTFIKADNADHTLAANQDRITPGVWITRDTTLGIFNIASETGYIGTSPAGTKWATGTTADLGSLTFYNWFDWAKGLYFGPPNTVGIDAVLHLVAEDIYIDIKFTSWTSSSGGGFSYERSTAGGLANSPPTVTITTPTNEASVINPITITATASDTDGTIASVEFFDGTDSLGIDTDDPYTISANLLPGARTLTAVAIDNDGDSNTSPAIAITVSNSIITDPIAERVPRGDLDIELVPFAEGMASPLGMAVPDDGSGRMFVYDQAGQIWIVTANGRMATPLLDVRARLNPSAKYDYDERGLLGAATHPNFALNPYIYTYTSESNSGPADFPASMTNGVLPNHQSVITEWRIDAANSNQVDVSSRREVLRIDSPQSNHNGGTMRFGPDGFLYFTLGDGGSARDTGNGHIEGGNAQSTMQILGKIHRIDVDGSNSANGEYGIPIDNPFNGVNGLREIYAFGLRNPFAFSFDRQNGQLWLADVGQGKVEEINIITKGGNYGWNVREATFWFDPGNGQLVTGPTRPVPPDLIDPIAMYDHDDGLAVIGGFVYRGNAIPELQGRYVFGDWGSFGTPSGRLYFLDEANNVKEFNIGLDDRTLGHWLKGFGEGPDGELYVFCSRVVGMAGNTGRMLKIVPGPIPVSFVSIVKTGTNLNEVWCGGLGPYALQKKAALEDPTWLNLNFSTATNANIPIDTRAGFFRVSDTSRQRAIPLSASLSGAAERPPTGSAGIGFGLFSLEENILTFNIRYSGLGGPATLAHIHGPSDTTLSSGIQINLEPFNGGAFGTSGTLSGAVIVSDAQKAMILAGKTYVNVHTGANPGGEIRGQIAPVLMQIALSGATEHPPVNTSGTGLGELMLVGNQLTFNITYGGLSGPANAAHIHGPASMSQDAGVMINLAPYNGGAFGASGSLAGTVTLNPTQLASVIDGMTYVNVHTAAHGGGEIRGQIVPHSTAAPFTAPLTGLSEKPTAITNSATGSALFALEGNVLTFSMNYRDLSSVATAAHIHGPASSSQSTGVQIDLAPYNGGAFGTAGTFSGTVVLTDVQRDMVLNGETYVNVHTIANSGGEIRGQIAPVLMRSYLSGAEQRPAVFSNGTALGNFALVLNQLSLAISYRGLTGSAIDAHIHGPATVSQSAGVIVPFGSFNGGAWGTSGGLFGTATVAPSHLASIVDQLTYVNIHSTSFGGGEIRGHLRR